MIYLRAMDAGTRLWIRYDVMVIDADGNAADCVRGGHTCPMVSVYVYGPDDGGPDIVNVFGVGYGQPWPGGWRMPAGSSQSPSN